MNTSPAAFSFVERVALQQMIDSPDAVECHGPDQAWQAALLGVLTRPSLRDSLNLTLPVPKDVDSPSQR